jgi:phage shock protein E
MTRSIALWAVLIVLAFLLAAMLSACRAANPTAAPATAEIANLPSTVDVATVRALQDRADVVLLDVREQAEYDAGHIPGVKLIPLGQVPSRMAEIPKDKTVIVTCRSGNRSGQAADFLRRQGYTNVHNMEGGITAWQQAGLPVEK